MAGASGVQRHHLHFSTVVTAVQSRGGSGDVVAATAGVRSDLGEADGLAAERRRLHDAFKQLWSEDDIIQVLGTWFLTFSMVEASNRWQGTRVGLPTASATWRT